MNHKYSTMAIFLLIGVSTIILVSGLDGSGEAGYIPVYFSPDRLIPSLFFVNGSNYSINGSEICTSSNNVCGGSTINNITYNITNNITNNFTVNDTRFVVNFTVVDDTTVTHTICLFNNTCFSTQFIDSTGSGGGFSADQSVNTTSNVTFDNLIVTTNTTSGVYKVSGYTITPSIFADNDANTGIMFDGPDIMSIHTGGIQAILINSLQYTGLGMTPNQRLTVNGSGNFTENVTATNFRGNLNWSFLQNIPSYIIDYIPLLNSLQTNITNLNTSLTTKDNQLGSNITLLQTENQTKGLLITNLQLNITNLNTSLQNNINNLALNVTQLQVSNSTQNITINHLIQSNITLNTKIDNLNITAIKNTSNANLSNLTVISFINASDGTLSGSGICTSSNGRCSSSLPVNGIFVDLNVTGILNASGTTFLRNMNTTGNATFININATDGTLGGNGICTSGNGRCGGSSTLKNITRIVYQTIEATRYGNTTINDLNITLQANSNYSVFCNLLTSSAAATTGEQISVNASSSINVNLTYQTHSSATVITPYANNGAGVGFGFADAGSFGTNAPGIAFITGRIETGGSSTILWYGFKSEVYNSAVRIFPGSYCEYTRYT